MATSIPKIAEELVNLKVKEVQELLEVLKTEYNIEPAAAAAVAVAAPSAEGAGEDEKTEFTVKIKEFNQGKKMDLIKAVKAVTGGGLIESKKLVDEKGVVKEKVSKDEAEKIKTELEAAGATIELK